MGLMKMATLQEMLAQKRELEAAIALMQGAAKIETIAKIKALMDEFGLTIVDIVSRAPKAAVVDGEGRETKKAPVKFRNNATGEAWSGRGLQPKWLRAALAAGAKLEEFSV
jgi:DNA-binding protein H-NS